MSEVGRIVSDTVTEMTVSTDTILGRLIVGLRDKAGPLDGHERPAAVLWPDPDEEWRPLLATLRERLPEFLALGVYDEAARTGPAIWLRAAVDGELGISAPANGRPPILYLPAVSRQQLRAGDDCPDGLKPLVELLYRGAVWAHPNGREWTVRAFLSSPKSLGLDVADDAGTRRAMLQALPEVAVAPLGRLASRRLDADFFRRVLSPDPLRDVLQWLGEGDAMRSRLGPERWGAFRGRCRDELDFDPQTAPDVAAGERLGSGEGEWARVWERFLEAPESYEWVADVLLRSRPAGVLPFESERWPDLNAEAEEVLRLQLEELRELSHDDACRGLVQAEEEHGRRRYWVWARLGLSPLAVVLAPLARLAAEARTTLAGGTPGEVARGYVEHGWAADAAAREALAAAGAADRELVAAVVRRLMLPWLEDGAHAFQAAAEREALPARGGQPPVEAEEGTCLLFVDGLRYELAHVLAEQLEGRGFVTDLRYRWAALPTLTATGKPAATPVAADVTGAELGADFTPAFEATGRRADAEALRTAIEERGYQVLGAGTLGRAARQSRSRLGGRGRHRQARARTRRGRLRPQAARRAGGARRPRRAPPGRRLEEGPGRDRPWLAADARRAAQGRPASASHRQPGRALRRGGGRLAARRADGAVALERERVVRLGAGRRRLPPVG